MKTIAQHHACAAAKLVVVHLTVPAQAVFTKIVEIDFKQTLVFRPLHDRVIERAFQQFGQDGDDVESHGRRRV